MITFSQQDSRWVNTKFGGGYTIGRWGCTVTDLTMVYDWFYSSNMTPDWMASKLSYSNGMVIWASLSNVRMALVSRVRVRNDAVIREALNNPNECCIVEVNHNHWLFIIGRSLPVLGYKVVDPWDGRIKYTNSYKNNITGSAVIRRA